MKGRETKDVCSFVFICVHLCPFVAICVHLCCVYLCPLVFKCVRTQIIHLCSKVFKTRLKWLNTNKKVTTLCSNVVTCVRLYSFVFKIGMKQV